LEHFVFNEVRYDQSTNYGYYEIDAVEANWAAARREGAGQGHILRPKEGYFPVPPADALQDARTEMVTTLEKIGILVEAHHHYIAGLLKHAPALLAICAPTVNSYRRLVPGFEAPVNLGYSQRNRSAACRIPMYSPSPKAKRVEFRCPDPSCNPYLAFAAMLMA